MRLITKRTLALYRPDDVKLQEELDTWVSFLKENDWKTPADVKLKDPTASILKNGRVVFNIMGNKYRIVTSINYRHGVVYVAFIGSHAEYDKIDANTVSIK